MFVLIVLIDIVYSTVLTITQPTLKIPYRDNNSMPVNVADFGYVPYGRTVTGNIIFINDTCQTINQTLTQNVAITYAQNCTFLSQAMNVQKQGAKILIIIDNKDEDVNQYLLIAEHSQEQSFIPSIMIEKKDGDFILNQLETLTQNITVSIYFELHQKEIVELKYFLTTFDYNSYEFLYEFWPFAQQMIDKMNFEPLYVQYYCKACQQKEYNVATSECISGGRYCAYDPDNDGPLTGRDVVLEDLRQLCIYQTQNITKWWNYMILFYEVCFKEYENCPNKIMKTITINTTEIDNCMNDSFEGQNHLLSDNKILRQQRQKIQQNHFVYWPSLSINGDFYKGDLYLSKQDNDLFTVDDFAVLEAICDGFLDTTRPSFCNSTGFFTINDGEIKEQQSSFQSVGIWIGIGMFVFFILFATFLLYRRHLMKKMKNDVGEQVDSYLKEYYKMEEVK